MEQDKILDLDPIIHAPVRLAILSILINVDKAEFNYLKEMTATSDGNLSTHLNKLEANNLVQIEKTYKGKKPQTLCSITDSGRTAFQQYVEQMEKFIRNQKI